MVQAPDNAEEIENRCQAPIIHFHPYSPPIESFVPGTHYLARGGAAVNIRKLGYFDVFIFTNDTAPRRYLSGAEDRPGT